MLEHLSEGENVLYFGRVRQRLPRRSANMHTGTHPDQTTIINFICVLKSDFQCNCFKRDPLKCDKY